MTKFIFDLDEKRQKGILQSNFLGNIREHFSVKDDTAKIKQLRFNRYIPTRKYAITPSGRFEIGLLGEIYKYINSLQIPFKIVITDKLKEQFKPSYDFRECNPNILNKKLRDYQLITVKKCLKQGNGIVVIATAGGKTLITASLIKTINDHIDKNKTLIIVPGIQLIEQTYTDFLDYGINKNIICKWSGKNKLDKNAKIIIAGLSILQSKKQDTDWIQDINLLIFDECHKVKKQNQINNILKQIKTPHKFGLTGTMPENKIDQWNVVGKFGPIIYEKPSYELRKQKYIANAMIQILQIEYKTKPLYIKTPSLDNPTAMYEEENDFLYQNSFRNKLIATLSKKVDKNILVLVDRIEHGKILTNEVKKIAPDKNVYFIRGEVEVDDREKIRSLMEKSNNVVCIAITKIFSTGINIKNLHYIIFALVGKAKVKIIQSIGRGLRLHDTKERLVIFDIADELHYSIRHLEKRIMLYKKEKLKYETRKITEK